MTDTSWPMYFKISLFIRIDLIQKSPLCKGLQPVDKVFQSTVFLISSQEVLFEVETEVCFFL